MNDVTRRTFLGAAGASTGVHLMSDDNTGPAAASALSESIRQIVQETPFVDTHEHFWEESLRVRSALQQDRTLPAPDFGMLLSHYTDSDLQVAGMPADDYKKLLRWEVSLQDKWQMFEPWYARCRHTGYQFCVRETVRALFGEDDLREDNYEKVSRALAENVRPGFYERLLRVEANVEYAHVNCLQHSLFRDTEQPGLLGVDLSINPLCVPPNLDTLASLLEASVSTMDGALEAIDACFAKYGPRAIALKSQCAYWRPLEFPLVPREQAALLFKRYAKGDNLRDAEISALESHLFHYCMEKAAEYRLPVKLHTGYFAGTDSMPLNRVRRNIGDLFPVFQAHPKTQFILFHIAYPYQNEAIAAAKQYSNVYADMCWAWIINPVASTRFLKEFIVSAPASKLFSFGGDYLPVELTVGHAAIARRGITRAVTELVAEGWLEESDVPALVRRVMHGNARELYDKDRVRRNSEST